MDLILIFIFLLHEYHKFLVAVATRNYHEQPNFNKYNIQSKNYSGLENNILNLSPLGKQIFVEYSKDHE